jgi:hypothetical protein
MKLTDAARLKAVEEACASLQEQIADLRRQLNRTRYRHSIELAEPEPFPLAVEPGAAKPGAE